MTRPLYTLLLRLALPFIFLRLWWRGREAPAYRLRWRERLGFAPDAVPQGLRPLWLHCVSVGETLAAQPLVRALQQQYPGLPLLVTTMTPTGSDRVRAIWGEAVHHVYAPYDFPGAIARFLAHWQPRGLVILETELWPNLLAGVRAAGLPVVLANARLSERSAAGYAKAGRLGRELMGHLTAVAAQDAATAERFLALGVPPARVSVTGTLKYDSSVPEAALDEAAALQQRWLLGARPVWVAASTHAGEDEVVLTAHHLLLQRHPDALLILVPRHPERFDAVAAQVVSEGFHLARRSAGDKVVMRTQVLLGDSMGELMAWFALAHAALVGGSLVPPGGGHNVLEPLALGVPACTGPHYTNFQTINDELLAAEALAVVPNAERLAAFIGQVLQHPEQAARQREAGLAVLAANRGAVARQLALIAPWLTTWRT